MGRSVRVCVCVLQTLTQLFKGLALGATHSTARQRGTRTNLLHGFPDFLVIHLCLDVCLVALSCPLCLAPSALLRASKLFDTAAGRDGDQWHDFLHGGGQPRHARDDKGTMAAQGAAPVRDEFICCRALLFCRVKLLTRSIVMQHEHGI